MSALLDPRRFLDLTHVLNDSIPLWEAGDKPFSSKQIWTIEKDGAVMHEYRFAKAGVGTHMDAAGHIVAGRRMMHQYGPLDLISPLCILDVKSQVELNGDYAVQPQDITDFEKQHGKIPPRALVLMDSGWTQHWGDPVRYLSFDSNHVRHFPGWSAAAARMLLERDVNGVAVDTMSMDAGCNIELETHRAILGANKYGVENVKIVPGLPAMGATAVVAPLFVEGGSEAACRVFVYV